MVDNATSNPGQPTATAALEFLTGPARGTAFWLSGAALDVLLQDDHGLRITAAGNPETVDRLIARLHPAGASYEIEARNQQAIWVNGERIDAIQLQQRDMVEFGDSGPLTRFRLYRQGDRLRRSLGDMLADCLDYGRVSRKPKVQRWQTALRKFGRDFVVETTAFFRLGVVAALIVLTVISYQQYRASIQLQQQAASSAGKLEQFARTLTRTNEQALRPADLNRLRQELSHSLTDTTARLEQLELRSAASTRIIAEATRSIVFLQGSYGFRDTESGRMLRYQVDEAGDPLFTLRGQPLLSLEGDGEIAERPFTGTGFVINSSGALLTNRHVALPWEDETSVEGLIGEGMKPVLIKFVAYLPGIESGFPVELRETSDEADLAILQCLEVAVSLPYLRLSAQLPAAGDEVIVMGYPTGMRSMLAQTGDSFLADLQRDESLDFWDIAQRLSQAKFIQPLASRGIVGQRSATTVVYDADTTHGGSGGPVLDINGNAIAINTAIIPEYGGSNFGVPVAFAHRLLRQAGINIELEP